ncbi:hypothetical protein YK56LOC_35340 [Caballeronia sp. HLA56]
MHCAAHGASATTVEETIHWGSAGGASALGLDAVGPIEIGIAADFVLYDVDDPRFYGFHDLAVAPVTAGEPASVRSNIVIGRVVVDDGVIPGLDQSPAGRLVRVEVRPGMQINRSRIGILTPSSNTALEPIICAMMSALPHVSAHFSRSP